MERWSVAVAGIGGVTPTQMRDWRNAGLVPKLVGPLQHSGGAVRAAARSEALPGKGRRRAGVRQDEAIRVVTDAVGETLAPGGGTEPLAAAR